MICIFKLKNDIRKDEELDLARLELRSLIGKEPEPIVNFFDTMAEGDLKGFTSTNRIQDVLLRLPHLGKIQGYRVDIEPRSISPILRRTAYIKEVYAVLSDAQNDEELLQILDPENVTNRKENLVFRETEGKRVIVRMIPLSAIFDYSYAITKRFEFDELQTKFQRLLLHLRAGSHRIARLSGLERDVEDLVDAGDINPKYLLHNLHDFHGSQYPRMVRALMNMLKMSEGDLFLDPFNGGGTMCFEAILMKYNAIGNEINPLFARIAEVKCNSITVVNSNDFREVAERLLRDIDREIRLYRKRQRMLKPRSNDPALDTRLVDMIGSEAAMEIATIRRSIDENQDIHIRELLEVLLSDAIFRQRKIRRGPTIFKYFKRSIFYTLKGLSIYQDILKKHHNIELGKYEGIIGDARKLEVPSNHVCGIVTSPPYLDAERYAGNSDACLLALGMAADRMALENVNMLTIGTMKSGEDLDDQKMQELPGLAQKEIQRLTRDASEDISRRAPSVLRYYLDMRKCINEMYRVLRKGSRSVLIVADPHFWILRDRVVTFPNASVLVEQAKEQGFKVLEDVTIPLEKGYKRHRIQTGERCVLLEK